MENNVHKIQNNNNNNDDDDNNNNDDDNNNNDDDNNNNNNNNDDDDDDNNNDDASTWPDYIQHVTCLKDYLTIICELFMNAFTRHLFKLWINSLFKSLSWNYL